ncbi:MAG: nucleotidyl transferase AbiEii/AbiGii toxin family protein [Phycisphaerae bacterium]|nr:nucleotidyl transferase AbiEii/AbiGii toxin family protein [Phycisphaerae bacterium]
MDKVANLSKNERRDLFRETAARRAMNPAVVEKDFWVCWVLMHLFADATIGDRIVFKGGTSLSKVFGLIDRFSEDVDLILDWRLLGYGPGQRDPFQEFESATQRDRFNKQFNEQAAAYIADTFVPDLERVFAACPQVGSAVDSDDPQAVNVAYPAAFSEDYLRPEVRLEIGPLASWVPSDRHTILPYSAQSFPAVFDDPGCSVVAISAERTFWEKATILHQQAHRTGTMPSRYSRHYYDMYKLAGSATKDASLADLALLRDVVTFKQRFYPSRWARYEDATPGTFKLVPAEARVAELRRDYRDMATMIFGDVPAFDLIMDTLGRLEDEINGLPRS